MKYMHESANHPVGSNSNRATLTEENYLKGFLVDDEWMAGISIAPNTDASKNETSFVAFIVSHASGEYVAYQPFSRLDAALMALNSLPRQWSFEKVGGCGSGSCGEGGCKGACSANGC